MALGFLAIFLIFTFPQTARPQAPATGVITGRISNVATNENLEGATVRLPGTQVAATTQRDGTYRIQVPAGNYTVTASYTGLDPQSLAADVPPTCGRGR